MISGRLGFMQGRLSPPVGNFIQAFPWEHWQAEFPLAESLGLTLMEWTLDHAGLAENPFVTSAGQKEIRQLQERHGVRVPSVTGDNFMQAPFYKVPEPQRSQRLDELRQVIEASQALGVRYIVFPLVDNGAVNNEAEKESLLQGLHSVLPLLKAGNVRVVFEQEREPKEACALLDCLDAGYFGVNFDIGNSASIGLAPDQEVPHYGTRLWNVHIKDRLLRGTTVPLGTGSANIPLAFEALKAANYQGNFILQAARAKDGNHVDAIRRYRTQVLKWWGETA